MRAAVLGPLEVTRGDRRVEPTSPKQRALLIDLLIHRGETLGRDRLIDDLWGDDPPATAAGVLQNYVSQLRRALGPDAVRTVGAGYAVNDRFAVDVDELEAHLERAYAARAAGDPETVRAATAAARWRCGVATPSPTSPSSPSPRPRSAGSPSCGPPRSSSSWRPRSLAAAPKPLSRRSRPPSPPTRSGSGCGGC